jgi:cold shock CspA family protein/ribosome-associated translation inhibitor RaiA
MDIRIEGRNLEVLPEWRQKIDEEFARLENHYMEPLIHGRAVVIGTHHHRLGAFEVHLTVTVDGDVITILRQGEFVPSLLTEAFDALDRRLSEHSDKKQQEVKTHEKNALHGKVIKLFPLEEYGVIEDAEGAEVYFHMNALKKGKFEKLKIGSEVKFVPEEGDKGLQAVWVQAT